jgi:hypothetical protein
VRFWHDLWCREQLLKIFFRTCLVVHVVKMCGWRIIFSFEMENFNGIYSLLDQCMIGWWK